MIDPAIVFDYLEKWGFPILFIVGQLLGWWYMKPHVELMAERVTEATSQVERSRANEERAIQIAQQSHDLARQTLEASKSIQEDVRKIQLDMNRKG